MEQEHHGTWDVLKHTELEPTDAYGRVTFGTNQRAKYVRVDGNTKSPELFELLTGVFKLPTPGVVLSVTGSLLDFAVSPKIQKVIQRGMMKAAITTNGWITTLGYNCGHVQPVGQALRTHNGAVPCIGFPSWGCLLDEVQETLVIKQSQIKKGVNHCNYPRVQIAAGAARENLEGNHSHFILADHGGVSDWGSECHVRSDLEAYMSDTMNIPVVLVVLQGGIGVARQLELALEASTPAVIVYGSGGVCDLVVQLIRHDGELQMSARKLNKARSKLQLKDINAADVPICSCSEDHGLSFECPVVLGLFDGLFEDKVDKKTGFIEKARDNKTFVESLNKIVSKRDLLILYDMAESGYDGLDTALLEALVKAQNMKNETSSKHLSGVQVALGWNRPDFAEKLLNADNAGTDDKAMGSLLIHALAWNLYEFAALLLSHGASIQMVAANMVVLYGSSQHVDHLKRYVKYNIGRTRRKGAIDLGNKATVDEMINHLIGKHTYFDSNVSNESDPFFELMVWAALSLYPELAKMMWKQTQEPIKGALFVVMTLKKLARAKNTIISNNDQQTLKAMIEKFEKLAINIVDCLHEASEPALRYKALNSGWERLNKMSYVDMAHACEAKDFAAHPACQELHDHRWQRGVTSEVGLFTVILATICPFILLTPLVTFKKNWIYKSDSSNSFLRVFARKIKEFWKSPRVKFWTQVEVYLLFLVYQTYVILTKMDKVDKRDMGDESCNRITITKVILYFWFALFMLDEIIQVYIARSFWAWYDVMWNRLDVVMYTVNLCGLILVNIPAKEDETTCFEEGPYNIGRIFLATSSILFYLRLLHMFTSDKSLGPTILMIKNMVNDMKIFLLLFMIIAIAFGVGYTIVLTDPSDLTADNSTMYGMVYYPLFQMYGELFLEELGDSKGAPHFSQQNDTKDSGRTGFVVVLIAIYMAMVVLMLVNILIAMFTDTYSKIKQREDVIFKFQRLQLLMEMEGSYLPPPLSIIQWVLWHIGSMRTRAAEKDHRKQEMHKKENKWFDSVIRSAVIDSLEDYLKKERTTKGSQMDALMKQNTKSVKQKIEKLQKYMDINFAALDSNIATMDNSLIELKNSINTNDGRK